MKIVVALDSFKGGLLAKRVCKVVAQNLQAMQPSLRLEEAMAGAESVLAAVARRLADDLVGK